MSLLYCLISWVAFFSKCRSETINCNGQITCGGSGTTTQCTTPNEPCIIICSVTDACKDATIKGGTSSTSFTLECSGGNSCGPSSIVCTTDVYCTVTCTGDKSCEKAEIDASDASGFYYYCSNNCPPSSDIETPPPSDAPTPIPTPRPSSIPTLSPISLPTYSPTSIPSNMPSYLPTISPSSLPTQTPSGIPSSVTFIPTSFPSMIPTANTVSPTLPPSTLPSTNPTFNPTTPPTLLPSTYPTKIPSYHPSLLPSMIPTFPPTTPPTLQPTSSPTKTPTYQPSVSPSMIPTNYPAIEPTSYPSIPPSEIPTDLPSTQPSISPTLHPTKIPSPIPSKSPSVPPTTRRPTYFGETWPPTIEPSRSPTHQPTHLPTNLPTLHPSLYPTTNRPTFSPTAFPSYMPTNNPTYDPTIHPTSFPSSYPTYIPTKEIVDDLTNNNTINQEGGLPFPIEILYIVGGVCVIVCVTIIGYAVRRRKKTRAESYFGDMKRSKFNENIDHMLDLQSMSSVEQTHEQAIISVTTEDDITAGKSNNMTMRMLLYQKNAQKIQNMKNLLAHSNVNAVTKGSNNETKDTELQEGKADDIKHDNDMVTMDVVWNSSKKATIGFDADESDSSSSVISVIAGIKTDGGIQDAAYSYKLPAGILADDDEFEIQGIEESHDNVLTKTGPDFSAVTNGKECKNNGVESKNMRIRFMVDDDAGIIDMNYKTTNYITRDVDDEVMEDDDDIVLEIEECQTIGSAVKDGKKETMTGNGNDSSDSDTDTTDTDTEGANDVEYDTDDDVMIGYEPTAGGDVIINDEVGSNSRKEDTENSSTTSSEYEAAEDFITIGAGDVIQEDY